MSAALCVTRHLRSRTSEMCGCGSYHCGISTTCLCQSRAVHTVRTSSPNWHAQCVSHIDKSSDLSSIKRRAWIAEQLPPKAIKTEQKSFQLSVVSFLPKTPDWTQKWPASRVFCQPFVMRQASLSITNSRSLLKLMSIKSVMPSNHLILYHPLLLLPSILPSIRVFSQWVSSLYQVAKVLELQLQHLSFQWIFRTDFL